MIISCHHVLRAKVEEGHDRCPVRRRDESPVALRDVVYISGADTVALADADDPAKVPAIGVVVAIIDPTNCRVQLQGEVGGFGGLVPNTDYYLDTAAGGITAAPPIAPGSIVQKIGRARDATTLVVETDLDYLVN